MAETARIGDETRARLSTQHSMMLDQVESGKTLGATAKALGISQSALRTYRLENPAFAKALDDALLTGGYAFLDAIRDEISQLEPGADAKVARVKLDCAVIWLEKRFPRVFGPRMALEIEHKVDLRGALTRARSRLQAVRAPQLIEGTVLSRSMSTDSPSVDALPAAALSVALADLLE